MLSLPDLWQKNTRTSDLPLRFSPELSAPARYICGEEARSSKAIDGPSRRAAQQTSIPRTIGLWQKTYRHLTTSKTFINVRRFSLRGIDWLSTKGGGGSRGLKFVGVSGHAGRSFELPWACPMREVISIMQAAFVAGRKSRTRASGLRRLSSAYMVECSTRISKLREPARCSFPAPSCVRTTLLLLDMA